MDFKTELRTAFSKNGSLLGRLIIINVAVFLLLRIFGIVCWLFKIPSPMLLEWVSLPSAPSELLYSPWTLLTYMFSHYEFMHFLFNTLWLYWMGRIFIEYFSQRQLVALYIYGGIAGALAFICAYAIFPVFQSINAYLIGASAAITAIVVAVAFRAPNHPIPLFLFGTISLKWIAAFLIVISVLSIDSENPGGNIAHVGGALIGAIFAICNKRNTDITSPFNHSIDFIVNLFAHRSGKENIFSKNKRKQSASQSSTQEARKMTDNEKAEMNKILDKIRQSGYAALTEEEKRRLFEVSKK